MRFQRNASRSAPVLAKHDIARTLRPVSGWAANRSPAPRHVRGVIVVTSGAAPSQEWRVILAAADTADMVPVIEYLTEEGCAITLLWPAKDLARQIHVLLPRLVVAAAPTLLDLLDVCRTVRETTSAPLFVVGLAFE